jgi:hypothetical protein
MIMRMFLGKKIENFLIFEIKCSIVLKEIYLALIFNFFLTLKKMFLLCFDFFINNNV